MYLMCEDGTKVEVETTVFVPPENTASVEISYYFDTEISFEIKISRWKVIRMWRYFYDIETVLDKLIRKVENRYYEIKRKLKWKNGKK